MNCCRTYGKKEDVHFHAVHEKQTMDCILPWREESVAILPIHAAGSHYRKIVMAALLWYRAFRNKIAVCMCCRHPALS